MDKKIAGLIGALSAAAPLAAAQAEQTPSLSAAEILAVSSFDDLLRPMPNALALLKIVDAAESVRPSAETGLQVAQYHHHHHHHHHHHGIGLIPGFYPHHRHHHHHHHHHHFDNGY